MVYETWDDFEVALFKLDQFSENFDGSEIHRAAVIQAFAATFEQCWKALQKQSTANYVSTPRTAFDWALEMGFILPSDESIWLQIISDRNLTSQTFRSPLSAQISDNILKIYRQKFHDLLDQLKTPRQQAS